MLGGLLGAAGVGFFAGLVATAVMTVFQYPFWRRWGLTGVLEWHENVCIIARLSRAGELESLLKRSFLLHFLNGGLASLVYSIILWSSTLLNSWNTAVLGILFGLVLWILTLYPIHRPVTGVSLHRHPLGYKPTALSIALHMVYGVIATYIIDAFI
jgi:hypothetical protein